VAGGLSCCELVFLIGAAHDDLERVIGQGRYSAFASSHAARIQTSRSSSVVRITGMALGWIGSTIAFGRQETIDLMRSRCRLQLGTPVAAIQL
jgi:hypothetical protein